MSVIYTQYYQGAGNPPVLAPGAVTVGQQFILGPGIGSVYGPTTNGYALTPGVAYTVTAVIPGVGVIPPTPITGVGYTQGSADLVTLSTIGAIWATSMETLLLLT